MIRSFFIATLLSAFPLQAATLPELSMKEWMGCWIGYGQNEFDYSVTAKDAKGTLYPKVRGKNGWAQAGLHDKFQIFFILEEQKGGTWTRIGIKEDAFETTQAASAEVTACELVATYDSGSKARIRHRFERKGLVLSTALEHQATENPTRVGILIMTPAVYRLEKMKEFPTEDEIKKLMKDDEIKAVRVDGKSFRFKLHEDVILSDEKLLAEGATEFSFESKRYGGKPIRFAAEEKGGGKILFKQSKPLYQMFSATWYPAEGKEPAKGAEFVIEF
jgi:hypothetical protein